MTFVLSVQKVVDYLAACNLCDVVDRSSIHIQPLPAKNFNLLVTLPEDRHLLVKQERLNQPGKTAGEFLNEWQVHILVQSFTALDRIRLWLSEVLHFDAVNSIVVMRYLPDYQNLLTVFDQQDSSSISLMIAVGERLATLHRLTWNQSAYSEFLNRSVPAVHQVIGTTRILGRITPEVFGKAPPAGIKFLSLCQRYTSLTEAITELVTTFTPCCLTHNDFKLNNILVHNHWQEIGLQSDVALRFIDWERAAWGDPSADLGFAIANIIEFWLQSLIVHPAIAIEDSLRMAMVPLDDLQPAIAAFIDAYLHEFPDVVELEPRFLKKVVQFVGIALLHHIQADIQYNKSFNNTGICSLQVAKKLLCHPELSMPTLMGRTQADA
ncbi:MAG TPA: LPS biosynthesis choline kinase [Cyanobacteria bacterium UBA11372]|nr:LPS biosynthesis choline kinase [Cyanobacteria bacterium UBA11372]